ncbi:MAG: phosphoribosylformylglycinamidine synthase subunit PurS [Candidatus Omnitrophica bacterium]|nr:phosphoribosylformylglycinamidine synthase subunit PurS [Candidatus Omnitrophota bacterium]HOX54991.1 phosphoribosylformylglycinamidine synthase subunit PurS [Candidatus Omnitrophota bacterium]
MIEAKICITLKKTVTDPQGITVKHALESLGYKEIEEVRVGKFIELKINTNKRKTARRHLDEMCKKLLANPVIENYGFAIKEVK